MRCFLAIGLPRDVVEALEHVQAGLDFGRAVPPDNLHLTLAFLDDQTEDRLEALNDALEMLSSPAFELQIRGLGVFGKSRPRLLYAGIDPHPALNDLRKAVRRAARLSSMVLPDVRYHPHITLARFGASAGPGLRDRVDRFLAERAAFTGPVLPVRQFSLYRSLLHPEGARYEELAAYPCAPGWS